MTSTCPRCGKVYLTEEEMKRCSCRPSQKCPECNGTGKKVQTLGPAIDCPRCDGTGKLYY